MKKPKFFHKVAIFFTFLLTTMLTIAMIITDASVSMKLAMIGLCWIFPAIFFIIIAYELKE